MEIFCEGNIYKAIVTLPYDVSESELEQVLNQIYISQLDDELYKTLVAPEPCPEPYIYNGKAFDRKEKDE